MNMPGKLIYWLPVSRYAALLKKPAPILCCFGGHQGQGDRRPGCGLGAGGAARCVAQVAPQVLEVGQVVVPDRAQPVAQPGLGEPVGLVLGGGSGSGTAG